MDLFFREYGSGPPLVILHGFLGAGGNWHTLARRVFADSHRVLVPDQRNHGRSPHSDALDYPTLADDLEDFLDARGIDRTVLLGHSMGGKVAMQFALTRPRRVTALVVVDITPRAYTGRHGAILAALEGVDPSAYERRDGVEEALHHYIADRGVRQLVMKSLDRDADGRFRWAVNVDALVKGYPALMDGIDEWATFEGPALFVRGERSDYVREEDSETIRAFFPEATLETIADAGHWVHADHPAAFGRSVRAFFAANGV